MNTAHTWRGKMANKYCISEDNVDRVVSISLSSDSRYIDGFIDIWTDDGEVESPFKDMETARMFAEILVKLLEQVS